MNGRYLVKHRKTTPYHPKANGLTKRCNGTIGRILNKSVQTNKTDWDDKLLAAVFAYNVAYKEALGQSPYFLVYGHRALVPVEFTLPTPRVLLEERLPEADSRMERFIISNYWRNYDCRPTTG